jgi:hypothetical protein
MHKDLMLSRLLVIENRNNVRENIRNEGDKPGRK